MSHQLLQHILSYSGSSWSAFSSEHPSATTGALKASSNMSRFSKFLSLVETLNFFAISMLVGTILLYLEITTLRSTCHDKGITLTAKASPEVDLVE